MRLPPHAGHSHTPDDALANVTARPRMAGHHAPANHQATITSAHAATSTDAGTRRRRRLGSCDWQSKHSHSDIKHPLAMNHHAFSLPM
jgi:hypothetical protein